MDWIVYCVDCGREIDRLKNGGMAEGYARLHKEKYGCTRVLLGQEVE